MKSCINRKINISSKSNKKEFKNGMTNVIKEEYGGLGKVIVVKKGVIVRLLLLLIKTVNKFEQE